MSICVPTEGHTDAIKARAKGSRAPYVQAMCAGVGSASAAADSAHLTRTRLGASWPCTRTHSICPPGQVCLCECLTPPYIALGVWCLEEPRCKGNASMVHAYVQIQNKPLWKCMHSSMPKRQATGRQQGNSQGFDSHLQLPLQVGALLLCPLAHGTMDSLSNSVEAMSVMSDAVHA